MRRPMNNPLYFKGKGYSKGIRNELGFSTATYLLPPLHLSLLLVNPGGSAPAK
jgi:hypothetical protein